MNIGYVSFVNKEWLDLANILVDHINEFSKYKIQLFTINCDANFDYPCLIKNRISIPIENYRTICYTKIFASFNNIFDFGLILDGDMIPLPNIDSIIDDNMDFYSYSYPICAIHPHSPPKDNPTINNLNMLKTTLGLPKSIKKYSYASYLFSRNSFEFLKNCFNICCDFESRGIYPINCDESVLNTLLAQIDEYKDIVYNYLPNYFAYSDFVDGKNDSPNIRGYTDYGCTLKFNILHGCKNVAVAKNYSDKIKMDRDKIKSLNYVFNGIKK